MAKQIALPIDQLRPDHAGGLLVTRCNAFIVSALSRAESWPSRCAIISGPARSGKNLLGHYFLDLDFPQMGNPVVIDHADVHEDELLFNAWNRAQSDHAPLLLLSQLTPSHWNIDLPDLKSRLGTALHLEIPEPDDDMVAQLLQKHLFDRGVAPTIEVVSYVAKRIERSYATVEDFARVANAHALAEGRALSIGVAREILEQFSE